MDYTNTYNLLELSNDPESRNSAILTLMSSLGLDYRTVVTLSNIYNFETSVDNNKLNQWLDPEFYTVDNCMELINKNMSELIPSQMYCNEEFLTRTKITKLPDNFLRDERTISSYIVHPLITEIGYKAFYGCENLKTIDASSVECINNKAFMNCIRLSKVKLNNNLFYIGDAAFSNCESLESIDLPEDITSISMGTFSGCISLTEVNCLNKFQVVDVEPFAFNRCENLKKTNIIASDVGKNAFCRCKSLQHLIINSDEIGEDAFRDCTRLKSILFIKAPSEIGYGAFKNCPQLHKVYFESYSHQAMACNGLSELFRNTKPDKDKVDISYAYNV